MVCKGRFQCYSESVGERWSRVVLSRLKDYSHFNEFIDDNILFDLLLCERIFTWHRGNGLTMSCLD